MSATPASEPVRRPLAEMHRRHLANRAGRVVDELARLMAELEALERAGYDSEPIAGELTCVTRTMQQLRARLESVRGPTAGGR